MTTQLREEYQIGQELGRGRFGVVYRCTSLSDNTEYAVKSIDKTQLADPIDREGAEHEANLSCLASVHNPGVVTVHSAFEDTESIHLIMDICDGPDLLEWIRLRPVPQVSEREVAIIMVQLMQILATCHQQGVAHRDIKPENLLFDKNGKIRLSDFGSAAYFGSADDQSQRNHTITGIVGTPHYVAPEILLGEDKDYSEKIDVWSAGVVMYFMLSGGNLPFVGEDPSEIFQAVLRGNLRFPFSLFVEVSVDAKDLMRRMMCKDPSRRFSANQVLRHPWIMTRGGVEEDEEAK